jgi:N-formylglutamate amidohydrolase
MKKFSYEDLQPHVEMLIDALENKGACASGMPYSSGVADMAKEYLALLDRVRNSITTFEQMQNDLQTYKIKTLELTGANQRHRIKSIVEALDSYIEKEFQKKN